MRRAETIWRSAKRGSLAALIAFAGCDRRAHPTKPTRSPSQLLDAGVSSAMTTSVPAPALPPLVASALEEVHEQRAEIPARSDGVTRLAFGKGRLVQAAGKEAVFRDLKDGSVVARADLDSVQAVSESVNGSLLALGLSGGVWLEPQLTRTRNFPRVAFFRGAALFPDLEEPHHFYVYYAAQAELFHYGVEGEGGSFLPIEDRFPLTDCAQAPSLTRDGAFLCVTANGTARRAPRGRQTRFQWRKDFAPAALILPAKRFDELHVVGRTGEVVRVRLEPELPVQARFQLPAPPFAAAANADALAFVLLTPPVPGSARRFTLLVTDLDGQKRFEVELPSKPAGASDDWSERVIADKNLALSRFDSLVAVGGANEVSVWDYASGRAVFSR